MVSSVFMYFVELLSLFLSYFALMPETYSWRRRVHVYLTSVPYNKGGKAVIIPSLKLSYAMNKNSSFKI